MVQPSHSSYLLRCCTNTIEPELTLSKSDPAYAPLSGFLLKLQLPPSLRCFLLQLSLHVLFKNSGFGSMTGYSFSGLCSLCLLPLAHSVSMSASFTGAVIFISFPPFIFLTCNRRTVSRGRKARSSLQSIRYSRLWYLSLHFLCYVFSIFIQYQTSSLTDMSDSCA